MTPEGERPTGWLVMRDGKAYGSNPTLYRSLSAAEDKRLRLLNTGIKVTPEPVWTRAAWEAEMARLDIASRA